jgi:membrane-bound ClpP family serine protease
VIIVFGAAFMIFYAIVKDRKPKISTGVGRMTRQKTVGQTTLNAKDTVSAEEELWTTLAEDSTMEPGEEVTITRVEGLKLYMTKKSKEREEK